MAIRSDDRKKLGRPRQGTTRKVSITLTDDEWAQIFNWEEEGHFASLSEYFRNLHLMVVKKI